MDRWWLSIVAVVVPLLGFLVPLFMWGVFQRHGEESTMAWLREAVHHGEHHAGHGDEPAHDEPEPEPVHVSEPEAPAEEPVKDDLKRIEGIGPKIESVLNAAGITTFAQVAERDAAELKQTVVEGGVRISFTETWPEQAALAAEGDWEELATLQDRLKGGRIG